MSISMMSISGEAIIEYILRIALKDPLLTLGGDISLSRVGVILSAAEQALDAAIVALSFAYVIGGTIDPSKNNARVRDRITRFIVTSPGFGSIVFRQVPEPDLH